MKRSLLEVYAVAVCFATLLCFVCALGIGLYDVVQISAPEFTVSPYYDQAYQTRAEFERYFPDKKGVSDQEIANLRDAALGEALRVERHSAVQSLVQVLLILSIDAGVFAVHWRMAKRAEPQYEP